MEKIEIPPTFALFPSYLRQYHSVSSPYPHRIHSVKLWSGTSFCPCEETVQKKGHLKINRDSPFL